MTDRFTVLKPFKSERRKFAVGQEITRDEDMHPHDFDDFVARGFIGAEMESKPGPMPAQHDDAA